MRPTHVLQLNKYCVVEEHFLLVTKGAFLAVLCMHAEIITCFLSIPRRIPKPDVAIES